MSQWVAQISSIASPRTGIHTPRVCTFFAALGPRAPSSLQQPGGQPQLRNVDRYALFPHQRGDARDPSCPKIKLAFLNFLWDARLPSLRRSLGDCSWSHTPGSGCRPRAAWICARFTWRLRCATFRCRSHPSDIRVQVFRACRGNVHII